MLTILFVAVPFVIQAQPNTEIYVFDLSRSDSTYTIQNPVNITHQNPGYDNQPYFTETGDLLFVSTRQGQTDVAQVELTNYHWKWLTTTPGSEYSPTQLPESNAFSAINLEKDGTQLLWKYPTDGPPVVIIPDVVIGYHCWADRETLVTFVLGEPATLQVCNVKTKNCQILATNIGRSLHKIPEYKNISYVSKKYEHWEIISLDPLTGKSKPIIATLSGSEDMCWSPNGTIFMGKDDQLYSYNPTYDKGWRGVKFEKSEIFNADKQILKNITRLAINPAGNKIAIVVEQ